MRTLMLVLLVAACGSTTPYYDYTKEPDPRSREYVIGVSDQLRIQVWKNDGLDTEAVVRPDGTITMPLIGDLTAAGLTPSDLKTEITRRLQQFIRDESAVVTVAVLSVNSYKFTVDGNVTTPGIFQETQYVTVSEAIARAGGLNRFANAAGVLVVRGTGDKTRRIPVNYNDIRSGKRPDMNIVLLRGDTVFVP